MGLSSHLPKHLIGFPLNFASALGQVCGLSQSHQALSVPGEEGRSSEHLGQAIEHPSLSQREGKGVPGALAYFPFL